MLKREQTVYKYPAGFTEDTNSNKQGCERATKAEAEFGGGVSMAALLQAQNEITQTVQCYGD